VFGWCRLKRLPTDRCRIYVGVSQPVLSGGSFHVQEVIGSVKIKDEAWNTHQWLSNPRRLKIEPSNPVLQYHCVRCGRDFLTDPSSNIRYAVFVSVISFDHLTDEVTKRWLSEPCPGRHLSPDDDDRTKIVAAFRVSNNADLRSK